MGEPKPNFRWRRKRHFQPVPYFIEPSKLDLGPDPRPGPRQHIPAFQSSAAFVAVHEDTPQTERYRRSYHAESELDLIAILKRDRDLGPDRPHREVMTPCLQLLRRVAAHAAPFDRLLVRLAELFDRAIFDRETRLLFYDVAAIRAADAVDREAVVRDLTGQADDLRAVQNAQLAQIASLQDRLAEANVRVREGDMQLRSQAESISKLKALLQAASESADSLHAEMRQTAGAQVMNSSLQRELDDLRVRYAQQRKENVESLELLNQTMEAKLALQRQVEEMAVARPKRRSTIQLPRSRSQLPSVHVLHRQAPLSLPPEPDMRSMTPRPDWRKITRRTHLELSEMSTAAAVDVLVRALATRNMKIRLLEREEMLAAEAAEAQRRARQSYMGSAIEYIEGLGTADSIPRYLRISGKVRRRILTKRQTELTVRDIWLMKKAYDRQRGTRSKLADYVYTYLSSKYGATTTLQEWGYSLIEALKAYEYDADIRLFEMVLRGEVSEDVYDDQGRVIQHVLEACAARDPARTGALDRRTFVKVLLRLFPGKAKPNMRLLVKALERETQICAQGQVQYERLFEENRDGDQGPFAECLRDQHLSEIMSYYADIKAALDAVAEQTGDGRVTGQQVRDAIRSVEKRIPKKELSQIIEDVFEVPASKAARRQADVFKVMSVIKSKGVHKRLSRPPEHEDDLLIDAHVDDGSVGGQMSPDPAPDDNNDSGRDGDDRELHSDDEETETGAVPEMQQTV